MEPSNKELDEILDAFDVRKANTVVNSTTEWQERYQYIRNFEKHIFNIVEPTFREFGDYIKARGHGYRITKVEDSWSSSLSAITPLVIFHLYLNNDRPYDEEQRKYYPYLSMRALSSDKKIILTASGFNRPISRDFGASGVSENKMRFEYTLEEINAELIKSSLTGLLAKVLSEMPDKTE